MSASPPSPIPADPFGTGLLRPLRPVASVLGVDHRLLAKECEAGRLPIRAFRIGPRRLVFLCGVDVDNFVNDLRKAAP